MHGGLQQSHVDQIGVRGAHEPGRCSALAVRDRRLDARRDQVEQRQRELHDLPRHAVGMAQLFDRDLRLVGKERLELLPAAVHDGARRLRDVAQDRQRAVGRTTRHRE